MDDLKNAEAALFAISPDIPYDEWMRVGMAARAAGISFEVFDQWSAGGCTYKKSSTRNLWKSYRADKGIGAGTLFHIAKEHGYTAGTIKSMHQAYDEDPPFVAKYLAKQKANTSNDAQAVWDRSTPATLDHPYILRKNGSPEGLRVIPIGDPLHIMGQSMAGALAVPVWRQDGAISSLQLIASGELESRLKAAKKPTKLNLPGCNMEGWFMVGRHTNGGRIFICEGIGQAWACWQAAGQAAVVAFGWGRVGNVAKQIQALHPDARIILVPDKGKELDAAKIAKEVGCHSVSMPTDWPDNSDVNDLAARDGADALEALLDQAKAPQDTVQSTHPLAQYIDFDCQPRAPKWVIPGFIGHGVVIIAGAHGVGKTTALLPLSMVAAGLHAADDPLAPKHWRHVIYIVEDIEQAQRILAGMVGHSNLQLNPEVMRKRLHLVEASRMEPIEVAAVGATYKQQFTRVVDGVEILPLVVMDTKAAVLAMENENDNAQGSAAMAALKQGFEGLPTWIIGHVAKQDLGRADAATMTLRGGSSFEADANQVLYLVKEKDDTRYLVRGKTRFEAKWSELKIDTHSAQTEAKDEFGSAERVVMRWGIPKPAEVPRHEQWAQAQEDSRQAQRDAVLDQIVSLVDQAHLAGTPLNREGVKSKIKRKRNDINDALNQLISEGWLFEVDIPSEIRTNPKRRFFLVAFNAAEREAFLEDGVVPDDKLVIPPSWRKLDAAEVQAAEQIKPRKAARQSNVETVRTEPSVSP